MTDILKEVEEVLGEPWLLGIGDVLIRAPHPETWVCNEYQGGITAVVMGDHSVVCASAPGAGFVQGALTMAWFLIQQSDMKPLTEVTVLN